MGVDRQTLVSIVTPVYNGEKYIQQSVESVLAQTHQNWEYIVVNNCSTDRTLEIVTAYARREPRIKVYTNDRLVNLLQNHNRAVGWISPESKYCKILHADDWLFPNCIEMMVRVNEEHPSVGIVGAYGLTGSRVVGDGLTYETKVLPGRELARLALLGRIYPFWSPSSLLIRSDLIRERTFFYNEEKPHADHMACYEMLRRSDFGFVHQMLTYIRHHDDSATSTSVMPLDKLPISHLDLLTLYGPEFLTRDEFERELNRKFSQDYQLMIRRFIENRDEAYWAYHREELRKLGYRFDRHRVLRGVFREFVAHPRAVVSKMYGSTRTMRADLLPTHATLRRQSLVLRDTDRQK